MVSRLKANWGFGGLLTALQLVWAASACAEPPSLKAFLFGAPKADAVGSLPPVARYESDQGGAFVFDHSSPRLAVLKFDGSPERLALFATPGPRGDVIYKNDMGEPVLRATRLGGLTLFTPNDPEGAPVAALGAVSSPRPPPMFGPEALLQVLVQASGRASRAAQHLVIFDAAEAVATPATESVFADAFMLTADAVVRVCTHTPAGHAAVAHLNKVKFRAGREVTLTYIGPIFQITLAPDLGVAGRPSSERIAAALLRH
jgi:hypothetical protein